MYIPINEVYFASKQACAKRASEREREREREGGRERRRGKRGKSSKISNQRGVLRLQASLCKAREREREGGASMSRIPINEVYFVSINEVYCVSKHVKNVTPYLL